MEQHQIRRVRDSIKKYHNHVDAERDVERMNLAIRLLDIILDEASSILHVENDTWVCSKYVNTKNIGRYRSLTPNVNHSIIKADLYYQKAWRIYHKLREEWLTSWWDKLPEKDKAGLTKPGSVKQRTGAAS